MDIVADWGCENFAKQPKSSVPVVVYDFYANACFSLDRMVYVREKWVAISWTNINQYYRIQDIEEDSYQMYLDNVDPDEVKSSICGFNTT